MKPKVKKKLDLTKVRTRYEPPTLEEAIFAAQGMTSDVTHQVAIASELTGKAESEVHTQLARMASELVRSRSDQGGFNRELAQPRNSAHRNTAAATVVVERRAQRSFSILPRSAAPTRG